MNVRPPSHQGDALSGLLDGELDSDQEQAVLAHLGACFECATELAAVRQARAWVRALPAVEPPYGFYARLLDVGGPHSGGPSVFARSNLRRRAGVVALGAAAAAVTVLGVGSPRQQPASPAAPRLVQARATSASVGADLLSKLTPMGVPVSYGR